MTQEQSPINRQKYLETAQDIASILIKNALWDGDRCNWLGSALEPVNGRLQIVNRTFGPDMYSGTASVAYFLSLLYTISPGRILEETLAGATRHMISVYDRSPALLNYSFYTGKIGLVYTLIQVGFILKKEEWIQKALSILQSLKNQPIADIEIDVISGVAGALPALLKIYHRYPEECFKEMALKCGDFLIAKAEKTGIGWSWPSPSNKTGLTGYSHGSAGAGTALMQLYSMTEAPQYREAAEKAFLYERHYYNSHEQNWPDLREDSYNKTSQSYGCGLSWCHGAPGIALSRLKAFLLTGEPIYKEEAEIALNTTARGIPTDYNSTATLNGNFSLCHGLAGNSDILISGAFALNQPHYLHKAEHVGNFGISRYGQNKLPWPSGVYDVNGLESNLETPGLMLGLAGTGYFYLRLFAPQQIESILCL